MSAQTDIDNAVASLVAAKAVLDKVATDFPVEPNTSALAPAVQGIVDSANALAAKIPAPVVPTA